MTETQEIVREFGGSRVSMAAEILRLRQALEEMRFDLSRAALAGVSGLLLDPMPRADVVPRPIGYRISDD